MHVERSSITVVILTIVIIIVLLFSLVLLGFGPGKNLPPEADLDASSTFTNTDNLVFFSANQSYDSDGKIVSYTWDFGDGTNATGKYVSHTYEDGGDYTVILIIRDDDGSTAIEHITIHINDVPVPMIDITLPAYIHEEVFFSADESYDPDGNVTNYYWDFGDGTNGTGNVTSHVYTERQEFIVTLIVTDNDNAKSATPQSFFVRFRQYNITWGLGSVVIRNQTEDSEFTTELGIPSQDILPEWATSPVFVPQDVNNYNITTIYFKLTWTDYDCPSVPERQPNDIFVMNINSSEGYWYPGQNSTSEEISMAISGINQVPNNSYYVEAETPDILRNEIAKTNTSENGTGEWIADITIIDAPDANPSVLPDTDKGNAWTLNIECVYYYPIITMIE